MTIAIILATVILAGSVFGWSPFIRRVRAHRALHYMMTRRCSNEQYARKVMVFFDITTASELETDGHLVRAQLHVVMTCQRIAITTQYSRIDAIMKITKDLLCERQPSGVKQSVTA